MVPPCMARKSSPRNEIETPICSARPSVEHVDRRLDRRCPPTWRALNQAPRPNWVRKRPWVGKVKTRFACPPGRRANGWLAEEGESLADRALVAGIPGAAPRCCLMVRRTFSYSAIPRYRNLEAVLVEELRRRHGHVERIARCERPHGIAAEHSHLGRRGHSSSDCTASMVPPCMARKSSPVGTI